MKRFRFRLTGAFYLTGVNTDLLARVNKKFEKELQERSQVS